MKTKLRIALLVISSFAPSIVHSQDINILEAHYKGKPIIEMSINNKKTWVLLDTGSDFTILNTESKDSYGFSTYLSDESKFKIQGLGTKLNQMYRVRNVVLKFGEKRLLGSMLAYDITNVAKSIHSRTGKMITAIIGTNMMKSYGFIIDMGSGTVMMQYKGKKKDKMTPNKSLMAAAELENSTNGN